MTVSFPTTRSASKILSPVFRLFVLLLFLLLYFSPVFSQEDDPVSFPTENAVWSMVRITPMAIPEHFYDTSSVYLFPHGDTLLNGEVYTKLYSTTHPLEGTIPLEKKYEGALREANGRVYFDDGPNYLVFDYSWQEGEVIDTLFDDTAMLTGYQVITKIDSIQLLDGTYRRRYRIGATSPDLTDTVPGTTVMIEGIGILGSPIFGLFLRPEGGIFLPNKFDYLLCFEQDGLLLFERDSMQALFSTDGCDYLSSSSEIAEGEIPNLKIYPNPARGIIYVESSFSEDNLEVQVFDISGKLVLQPDLSSPNSTIDISSLSAGMYFLKIRRGTEYILREVIKLP